MTEITTAGYQTFRDYLNSDKAAPSPWDYIELYDDTGTDVTRVSVTGDSRCQWLDVDGDNVLKVEFEVTGNDSDITLPVTLEASALWNSASGGSQCTPNEQFAQATLNQSGDTVTVTHTVKVPQ